MEILEHKIGPKLIFLWFQAMIPRHRKIKNLWIYIFLIIFRLRCHIILIEFFLIFKVKYCFKDAIWFKVQIFTQNGPIFEDKNLRNRLKFSKNTLTPSNIHCLAQHNWIWRNFEDITYWPYLNLPEFYRKWFLNMFCILY